MYACEGEGEGVGRGDGTALSQLPDMGEVGSMECEAVSTQSVGNAVASTTEFVIVG